MKKSILSLVVAAAFAVRAEDAAVSVDADVAPAPVLHTWTTLTGQEVKAEFVSLVGGKLTLRGEDGREHTTQLSNMAPDSKVLATHFASKSPAPATTAQEIRNRMAHENLMDRYQLMTAANKDFYEKSEAVKLLIANRRSAIEKADDEIAGLKADIEANKKELETKTAELDAVYAADGVLAELEVKLEAARKAEETVLRQQINIIGAKVRERTAAGQMK